MIERYPNLSGVQVTWQDDLKNTCQTTISGNPPIAGGTSYVYTAQYVDRDEAGSPAWRSVIVKVPKPTELVEHRGEWEKELTVLQNIAKAQVDNGHLMNVPKAFDGFLDVGQGKEDVLVMDYLDPQHRWLGLKDRKEFRTQGVFEAAKQVADLFKIVASLGYISPDNKPDNYYWLSEENRAVLTDWNRCLKHEPKSQEAERYLRSSYIVLLDVVYQVLADGAKVPLPLPDISAREPKSWAECRRPLKRLLIASRSSEGASLEEIHEELDWLIELHAKSETEIWGEWSRKFQTDVEEGDIVKRLERAQDVLGFWPKSERERLRDWVDEIKRDHERLAKDNLAGAKNDLKKLRCSDALRKCEQAIEKYQITAPLKWQLARWYAVSDFMNKLKLSNTSEAEQIVAYFDTASAAQKVNLREKFREECKNLAGILDAAQEKLQDKTTIYKEPQENIKKENAKNLWESSEGLSEDLPDLTRQVLRSLLPVIDLDALEQEEAIRQRSEEMEKYRGLFKRRLDQLIFGVGPTGRYPSEALSLAFSDEEFTDNKEGRKFTAKDIELDNELISICDAHKHASNNEWSRSLDILTRDHNTEQVIPNFMGMVKRSAQNWLRDLGDKKLFRMELEEIRKLAARGFKIESALGSRLTVADQANIDDKTTWSPCKDHRVEPWVEYAGDKNGIKIDDLINLETVKHIRGRLSGIEKEIDNLANFNAGVPKLLEQLQKQKQKAEEYKSAIVELRNGLKQSFAGGEAALQGIVEFQNMLSDNGEKLDRLEEILGQAEQTRYLETQERVEKTLSLTSSAMIFSAVSAMFDDQWEAALLYLAKAEKLYYISDSPRKVGEGGQVPPFDGDESDSFQNNNQKSPIARWKEHIEEIRMFNKAGTYQKWFDALKTEDRDQSYRYLQLLIKEEVGKPLFEYLFAYHNIRFGVRDNPFEDSLWKQYLAGEFNQVKRKLEEYKRGEKEKKEWEVLIDRAETLAGFIKYVDSKRGKGQRAEVQDFLKRFVYPEYVWTAAVAWQENQTRGG